MLNKSNALILVLASICLVCVVQIIFLPGVAGPFLLDDYANLSGLSQIEQEGGLRGVLQYLATNTSGALGRPISLLSFLFDANGWPADPEPFKRTNISLHAITSLLVFIFATQVASLILKGSRVQMAAGFIAAALWAVHPLQVSTVLYVVQRMTILSTLLSIAALSFFLAARVRLDDKIQSRRLLFGFICCATLAVFSKENGALVFALAWLLDWVLFSGKRPPPQWYIIWRRIFILAPVIALVLYFVISWDSVLGGYRLRDFTLAERLMTQPRVLGSYLENVFIPQSVLATLYHDSYIVSRGLLDPPTTLIAIVVLIGAILSALLVGQSSPLFALPILWFLIAHSMESSVIALEMVFEHRNYLPSIGIFLVLGLLFAKAVVYFSTAFQRILWGVVVVAMVVLTVPWTYQAVKMWSDESVLIYTWAFYDENSIRAQTDFAQLVAVQGQPNKAIDILMDLKSRHPDEITIRMRLASFYCEYEGGVPAVVWGGFNEQKYSVSRSAALAAAQRYLRAAVENQCEEINQQELVHTFSLLKNQEKSKVTRTALAHIHYMEGNFLVGRGAVELGMNELDHAAKLQPTVDVPLRQSILMLNLENYAAAEHYLQVARQRDEERSWRYPSRWGELDITAQQIQQRKDIADQSNLSHQESE